MSEMVSSQLSVGSNEEKNKILFLAWESPWPAQYGAALRSLGLLKELSRVFKLDLILLTRNPLSVDQLAFLGKYSSAIDRVPLRDTLPSEKLYAAALAVKSGYPYHCAILDISLKKCPDIQRKIQQFPGIIFTNLGHWGSLVHDHRAPNWILNQCDAEVEFWRVYASQASHPFARIAAHLNFKLANRYFPQIYANVGQIISVCEEDKQLTQALSPTTKVDVIENGVDCSQFVPDRKPHSGSPRILFTGTSASRNLTALRHFVHKVFPLIQEKISSVVFIVGGNFNKKSQYEFKDQSNILFTGRVDDMRPIFNQCDVYVAPFSETHGSKLKIAEAMAMGMAIVSTPAGIRGFSLVDGESVLIGRNQKQFAEHVVNVLTNPIYQIRLGTAARKVALATIDWPILGARLINIVNNVRDTL